MILQREHDVNCKVIYIALLIFASGSPPPRGPDATSPTTLRRHPTMNQGPMIPWLRIGAPQPLANDCHCEMR